MYSLGRGRPGSQQASSPSVSPTTNHSMWNHHMTSPRIHRVLYSVFLDRVILNIREARKIENPSSTSQSQTDDRLTFILGDGFSEFPVAADTDLPMTDMFEYELDTFESRRVVDSSIQSYPHR
jgi:hypothetical protein